MGLLETDILSNMTTATQSDLLRFFIIVAVVSTVTMIPIYVMRIKDRKERTQVENERIAKQEEYENRRFTQYMEREKRIIDVITENKSVIVDLKSVIGELRTALESDRSVFTNSIVRVHERIDKLYEIGAVQKEALAHVINLLAKQAGNPPTT
jgi:hypothetical protein